MPVDDREPVDVVRHRWSIEPEQYERHESRRGRRHAFEVVTPSRTALVVIDVVPFFVEANPYVLGSIPTINRLATTVRRTGGTVAWVLPGTGPLPPARIEFFGPDVAEIYRLSGGEGRPADRLWPGLAVEADDLVIEKSTPSAFFPGGSDLHERLQALGVDTVVIAGTVANVCVESSARDAATIGYRVVLAADALSAQSDADLNSTLHTVYRSFGDVRSADDVVGLLGARVEDADRGFSSSG